MTTEQTEQRPSKKEIKELLHISHLLDLIYEDNPKFLLHLDLSQKDLSDETRKSLLKTWLDVQKTSKSNKDD
jgi:hypothetical protein